MINESSVAPARIFTITRRIRESFYRDAALQERKKEKQRERKSEREVGRFLSPVSKRICTPTPETHPRDV